ncbi:MAG: hypothetical protein H0T62_09615 [Parachlamydiaceae bacterium]|nr:hypothetical protein [Parachlamydiaceae bacterium]
MDSINSTQFDKVIFNNREKLDSPLNIVHELAEKINLLIEDEEITIFDFEDFESQESQEISKISTETSKIITETSNINQKLVVEGTAELLHEMGSKEKSNSVALVKNSVVLEKKSASIEMTSIQEIKFHKEQFKDFIIFSATTPEQATQALKNGDFKNITEEKNGGLNLENRAFLDHNKHNIVVPTTSLLKVGSEHEINGVKYTVRHETKDEREKFESNWSSYQISLKKYDSENNKKGNEAPENTTKGKVNNQNGEGNNRDGLDPKKRIDVNQISNDGIKNKEEYVGVMRAINKKHNVEKEWLVKEITKDEIMKEIVKKNLNKANINLEIVLQSVIVGESLFIVLNILERSGTLCGHSARIVTLRSHYHNSFRLC